jgi:two-component system, OmpR family, sensor kinase
VSQERLRSSASPRHRARSPRGGDGALTSVPGGDGRPWRLFFSLRTRLVAWFALLLLAALVASLITTRWVLLSRLDARIDAALSQEADELRALVDGLEFGDAAPREDDIRELFQNYLERNVPMANEALITFVGGEPHLRSRPVVPYRLDLDPRLAEHWSSLTEVERASVATPAGLVRYLAVPVRAADGGHGVYVGAVFRDVERAEVDDALVAITVVGLVALAFGCLLAAALSTRVLDPVAQVTRTARRITETDLSERIPVSGRDEIASLTTALNDMLDHLEDAFETQRRFLDDAAHELRTPLTIVQGHVEQLGDDPVEREETLALVQDETERMGRLVNDLLVLARAERPDFLHLDLVDLEVLTRELYDKAVAFGSRRWELDAVARGLIVADRQRLTQAMMQLAENAIRHTEEDDVVALGSALQDGSARLWVRDSGPGVPYEDRAELFTRFRTGRTSNGRDDASGLGLSIVRAIAESHGGRVELRSRPGAGALFALVIPADPPHPEVSD